MQFCAEYRVWAKPNKCFEAGFVKNQVQNLRVGTNSPCLLRMQTQKPPEQKNNRPLQVELENGRSRLQNDFQILESMLRGFIAPASNADVYTSAYFALQNTCWEHPNP